MMLGACMTLTPGIMDMEVEAGNPLILIGHPLMPFGLTNAPATFERLMERVLRGLQWKYCLVYLEDIIIFGATFDDTLQNLGDVLDRLREANLQTKEVRIIQNQGGVSRAHCQRCRR